MFTAATHTVSLVDEVCNLMKKLITKQVRHTAKAK